MRIVLRKLDRPGLVLYPEDAVSPVTSFYLDEFGLVPKVPPRLVWTCKPFTEVEHDRVTGGGPPPSNQTEGYFSSVVISYGRRRAMVLYGDEQPNNFTPAPLPGREDHFQPYVKPTIFTFQPSPLYPDDGDSGPVSFSNLKVEDDTYRPYVPQVVFPVTIQGQTPSPPNTTTGKTKLSS